MHPATKALEAGATGWRGPPAVRKNPVTFRARTGNLIGRVILFLAVTYIRRSPVARGKGRVGAAAALLVSRVAALEPARMSVTVAGVTVALWLSPSSLLGALTRCFGCYEAPEIAAGLGVLARRRRPVVLDVGANAGLYSILAAAAHPGTRCLAVEADPRVAQCLRRNVDANAAAIRRHGASIAVIECALGDRTGPAAFYRARDPARGSLFAEAVNPVETIPVPTRRGDELLAELGIEEIDFCKIDVEGAELLVLAGLDRTLRAGRIHRLQVELNKSLSRRAGHSCGGIVEFLRARGYELLPDARRRYETARWQCENFAFARP
ncbi:MAG TPA: FkbM family methyltransferase [Opitutus sp.]|nr:FkbM family methyltransferase [Opitutus sp.]